VLLDSTSDTEVICALIAEHPGSLREATIETMARIRGAFAAVLLTPEAVIGFRDPDGIRPLVLGDLEGHPVLASETPALDIIGATAVRELEPGELVILDADGVHIEQAVAPRRGGEALCVFEHIYFARPDARMSGESLHAARERMGEQLAIEAPIDADVVIPVPDSGTPAAIGYARAAGLPFGDGLIKNRYVGRTFIQPNQELREVGLRLKFNPLPHVLDGKRVIVVDDSIVRGTTTRKIVSLLREAGAREVHLRVSSPPIISPCFYGVDMAAPEELIAAGRDLDEVRALIGADSLAYLSLEGLQLAIERPAAGFCRACLTGDYPVAPESVTVDKGRFEVSGVR
jgi:amidophosphoribosyltransferase